MVERDIPNIFVQVQVLGENLFHHTHVYGVVKIFDFCTKILELDGLFSTLCTIVT